MAQKEHKLSLKWLRPFLGSGPGKGQSPVEWGEIPSVRPSVSPWGLPVEALEQAPSGLQLCPCTALFLSHILASSLPQNYSKGVRIVVAFDFFRVIQRVGGGHFALDRYLLVFIFCPHCIRSMCVPTKFKWFICLETIRNKFMPLGKDLLAAKLNYFQRGGCCKKKRKKSEQF